MAEKKKNDKKNSDKRWKSTGGAVVPVDLASIKLVNKPKKAK